MLASIALPLVDWALHPGQDVRLVAALSVGTAAVLLLLHLAVRGRRLPARLAPAAAAASIGLAVANVLVRMALFGDPWYASFLPLLIATAGAFLLSWFWLVVLVGSTLAGWSMVTVAEPVHTDWHLLFAMSAAVPVAVLLCSSHRRVMLGLYRARQRFGGLVESALDVTLLVDGEAAIRYVSPSVERVLGWSPEELSGKSVLDLVHPDDRDAAALLVAEQLQTSGRSEPVEVRFRHTDGSWRAIEAVANDRLDDPSIEGFVVNVRDITERRAAKEAVREADERLRALVDASPLAVLSTDLDGTVRSWNPAAERIFGWTSEEAVGHFLPFVDPDRRGEFRELRDRLVTAGGLDQVEAIRQRKDGTQVPVSLSSALLRDAGGRTTGIMAILADITERRQMEERLRETEAKYRTLVEQIPAVLYVDRPDESMQTLYVSPRVEDLLGVSQEQYQADPLLWERHIHPGDRDDTVTFFREFVRADADGDVLEYRWVRPDGRTVWISDQATMIRSEDGRPLMIQGVMFDVTSLKNAEKELQESLLRFQALATHAPVGIFQTDPSGNCIYANERLCELGAQSPEQAMGMGWTQAVHPDDRERLLEGFTGWSRAGASGEVAFEYRLRHPDGAVRWVVGSIAALRDDGEITGLLGTVTDITERKEAEERLGEAEERFRTLVEQSPAVTFLDAVYHEEGGARRETLYISPQVEEMLGYPVEQWLAEPDLWERLLHPDERKVVERAGTESSETGTPFSMEYRLVARDGRTVWVHTESKPVSSEGDNPAIWQGIMHDVTERRAAEEVLRESQVALEQSLAALYRANEERQKVLAHIVGAEERERERIAEDVQDESLQQIVAVGMRLETLKRRLSDPKELGAVEELGKSVEGALGRLRRLLTELRPRTLDTDGLGAALRQYLEGVCRDAGLEFAVENRFAAEPPVELRAIAYRIAQEAITNVRRPPGATRVDVLLEDREGGYLVRVSGDGDGAASQSEPSGAGPMRIGAMRERAEVAGGWFRSHSAPGTGTTVEFWLPGRDSGAGS